MNFKVGDEVIYFRRGGGSPAYKTPQKFIGRVVSIGRSMITCDFGEHGQMRCFPDSIEKLKTNKEARR